jgi:hypothetical protein
MFNEIASTLLHDLTHKAPLATSSGPSLPEQAIDILVQIESLLQQSGPLSPSQLQKLKTLSKELAHLFPSVNVGPNQAQTAAAFQQFMSLIQQGENSGVKVPINQNRELLTALDTLLHNLMM